MKKWEIKLMFAVFYQRFESRDIDLLHWRGWIPEIKFISDFTSLKTDVTDA